jgi:hypothetical protein
MANPKDGGHVMLLVIQIAAGIVLGFAIIAYREALLKSAKWIAAIVGLFILIGVVGWIGTEAVGAAQPYFGKFSGKIGMILGGIFALVFGVLGGVGLVELCHEMGWLKRKPSTIGGTSENVIFAASVANVLLVYLVTWPVLYFTPIGDLYEGIDQWSRANGFADGGVIGVAGIFWLWPFLPLWFLARRKGGHFQTNPAENSLQDGEL